MTHICLIIGSLLVKEMTCRLFRGGAEQLLVLMLAHRQWDFFSMTMMTSSNGNFSALLAVCAGNSPVPGEFPTQRPVTRSFDVFFDLRLNKRLSKQSWGWWFETLSRPLWRQCNDFMKNAKLFFRENAFEKFVRKMSAIWLSLNGTKSLPM